MLDEREFLSPYGIRAVSQFHRDHPYVLAVNGHEHRVDYEPAESSTGLFGGNSNWRGPVWFPINYLLIEVAQILGVNFSGFVAWWLWRSIYLSKLPRFEKKVRVALDWLLDVVFSKDLVQFRTLRAPTISQAERDGPRMPEPAVRA